MAKTHIQGTHTHAHAHTYIDKKELRSVSYLPEANGEMNLGNLSCGERDKL